MNDNSRQSNTATTNINSDVLNLIDAVLDETPAAAIPAEQRSGEETIDRAMTDATGNASFILRRTGRTGLAA